MDIPRSENKRRTFHLLHLLKASQNIRCRIQLVLLIIRNSHSLQLGFVDEGEQEEM